MIFWAGKGGGGGKRAKNGQKWEKIQSVVHHISGSSHQMVVILGTHVYNDDISRCIFQFFKIFIFRVVRGSGVKEEKMAHNNKNFCVSYVCGFWYMSIKWWYLQQFSSFFQNSDFLGFYGGRLKKQRKTHYYQFQSVTLYISKTVDHIIKIFGTEM